MIVVAAVVVVVAAAAAAAAAAETYCLHGCAVAALETCFTLG